MNSAMRGAVGEEPINVVQRIVNVIRQHFLNEGATDQCAHRRNEVNSGSAGAVVDPFERRAGRRCQIELLPDCTPVVGVMVRLGGISRCTGCGMPPQEREAS